jgi:hypothetical protein
MMPKKVILKNMDSAKFENLNSLAGYVTQTWYWVCSISKVFIEMLWLYIVLLIFRSFILGWKCITAIGA